MFSVIRFRNRNTCERINSSTTMQMSNQGIAKHTKCGKFVNQMNWSIYESFHFFDQTTWRGALLIVYDTHVTPMCRTVVWYYYRLCGWMWLFLSHSYSSCSHLVRNVRLLDRPERWPLRIVCGHTDSSGLDGLYYIICLWVATTYHSLYTRTLPWFEKI